MSEKKPKIIAIVGPTASGKTTLSITLAEQFSGEIVSADSRQVYKGLDIGSGKVTKEEMRGVPHHLLDIAEVTDVYTAQNFVTDARSAVAGVLERGKVPIVVGGTFLYLDMLLGKASAPEVTPNPRLRAQLETESKDVLFEKLLALDPVRALSIDKDNPRRLVRAIEIATALGNVPPIVPEEIYTVLKIGIDIPKAVLHNNIEKRLLSRLEIGMVREVETLKKSGVSAERLEALGLEYRYLSRYLDGQISYEEMCSEIITKSKQFAKRQMTWLKRDNTILWCNPGHTDEILSTVSDFLKD